MAGFIPYHNFVGDTTGVERDFIIGNSNTVTLGDFVNVYNGFAARSGTTGRIMGVVTGIVNVDGLPLDAHQIASVAGTRSGTSGEYGSETYAAASNNQTVDQVKVRVQCDPQMTYIGTANTALATTDIGNTFQLASSSSNQVATSTGATTAQPVTVLTRDPKGSGTNTDCIVFVTQHQLVR